MWFFPSALHDFTADPSSSNMADEDHSTVPFYAEQTVIERLDFRLSVAESVASPGRTMCADREGQDPMDRSGKREGFPPAAAKHSALPEIV